jgi:hypothetical protein
MCHGARGLSQADTPNLAQQYPVAIYKESRLCPDPIRTRNPLEPSSRDNARTRDRVALFPIIAR